MKQLYLFFGKHLKLIKKLFLLSYIAIIATIFIGIMMYDSSRSIRILFKDIGARSGSISIILLVTSMIPGILKRMDILKSLESMLLLFRRQFGVLAFFFAVNHLMYISWIREIATGDNPLPTIFTYQQAGFFALAIFLLLWVISNNFSMKFLGKFWKYIQRLTYISVIALIIHVYAAGSQIWIILSAILAAEALSWFIFLIKKK